MQVPGLDPLRRVVEFDTVPVGPHIPIDAENSSVKCGMDRRSNFGFKIGTVVPPTSLAEVSGKGSNFYVVGNRRLLSYNALRDLFTLPIEIAPMRHTGCFVKIGVQGLA